MKPSHYFLSAALFVGLMAVAPVASQADDIPSCSGDKPCSGSMTTAKADIVDTAVKAGSFNTLVTAVKAADLVETLKGPGPFTVFAPSDAAFAKVPAATLQGLLADKAALTKVLTYHVVPGRITAAQAMKADWAKTAMGQSLRIKSDTQGITVDGARVIKADIETSNGIIHVIDRVVLPRKDIVDTAVAAGSFKTLVTAVQAADLVKTLKGDGPFTVFAPSDAAFAKLPAGMVGKLVKNKPALTQILTYHVVPGRVLSTDLKVGTIEAKTAQGQSLIITKTSDGQVTVNGAKVTSADLVCGNGVIHVIDKVVTPAQPQ
ncbi:MAG: fasciclin domain-containing protein [Planctomycetota bacterium]|nr:fasciclin domain-containing protein [Planctomycetota bacterium]